LRSYSSFLPEALEIENTVPFEFLVCGGKGGAKPQDPSDGFRKLLMWFLIINQLL